MREYINIILQESVNTKFTDLKQEVDSLDAILRKDPFDIVYDVELLNKILALLPEAKEQGKLLHDDGTEEEISNEEVLENLFSRYWKTSGYLSFRDVNREYAAEHDDYQARAAEKYGWGDDMSQYIESSNWLSAMEAQKKCADDLKITLNQITPDSVAESIKIIRSFMTVFIDNMHVSDNGEEPFLLAGMYNGLAELLPILKFISTK